MNEYPDEIRQRPLPVVAFVGQTSLHPLITKHLSRVTIESTQVNTATKETKPCFQVISWDFGYIFMPGRKAQKASYEGIYNWLHISNFWPLCDTGYVSQGIQKANWMVKHTSLLPAVLALFFQHSNEDLKNWKAKEQEIITQLDVIK